MRLLQEPVVICGVYCSEVLSSGLKELSLMQEALGFLCCANQAQMWTPKTAGNLQGEGTDGRGLTRIYRMFVCF